MQGCHFGAATQNVILVKLQNSLLKAGLLDSGVSLSASDETSIDVQCQTMYSYSPDALGCIAQVNTHCVRLLPASYGLLQLCQATQHDGTFLE